MDEPQIKNVVYLALHLLQAHFEGLDAAAREHPATYLALERRGLISPRKNDALIVLERLYHGLSDAPATGAEQQQREAGA